jgi:uncharacterized BrkB/YihY/UPF0761 family membrane protein
MASPAALSRSLVARWATLGRHTFASYLSDNILRRGAAPAFSTAVAIVPEMMLSMALGGIILGNGVARRNLMLAAEQLAGVDPSKALGAIGPLHIRPRRWPGPTWASS